MLNPKFRDEIQYPEFRLLYDLKIRLTERSTKDGVRKAIQNVRAKYNSKGKADPLVEKHKIYGNAGGWYKAKVKELEQVIYDVSKTVPEDFQGQWRSIEFEVIFNNKDCIDAFVSNVRKAGYSKLVTVKDDGSLRPDEDDRAALCKEVCVSYRAGNEKLVEDVCGMFKGRAYVNNTCGTHIHFDMRNVDEKTAKQYGERLARCIPALKAILPKSRRNNRFCATNINSMRGRDDGHHVDTNRYAFINMQAYDRHKTIEVRGHSATLRADKILNWIALCEKIMTTRIRKSPTTDEFGSKNSEIKDPNELIKLYKLSPELSKYIQERYMKFNNAKDIPPAPPTTY